MAIRLCDRIRSTAPRAPEEATAGLPGRHEELARRGERVLLFAYQPLPDRETTGAGGPAEGDFIFVGLAGLFDPPRPEVPAAVAALREAGVRVIMVTGDYQTTAIAIGRLVGIVTGGEPRSSTASSSRHGRCPPGLGTGPRPR